MLSMYENITQTSPLKFHIKALVNIIGANRRLICRLRLILQVLIKMPIGLNNIFTNGCVEDAYAESGFYYHSY
jgi:hypothetical protein